MITGPLLELLRRNQQFSETYTAPPPLLQLLAAVKAAGNGVVVISCCDPRLNPYKILGVDATAGATMIRNAGGRAFDAIRSLAVLQTLGRFGTVVVMHHTDCGLTHVHDADVRRDLEEISPQDKASFETMEFGEITTPVEESIKKDMALLRASPLIRNEVQIVGLKYDIDTGLLTEVRE